MKRWTTTQREFSRCVFILFESHYFQIRIYDTIQLMTWQQPMQMCYGYFSSDHDNGSDSKQTPYQNYTPNNFCRYLEATSLYFVMADAIYVRVVLVEDIWRVKWCVKPQTAVYTQHEKSSNSMQKHLNMKQKCWEVSIAATLCINLGSMDPNIGSTFFIFNICFCDLWKWKVIFSVFAAPACRPKQMTKIINGENNKI